MALVYISHPSFLRHEMGRYHPDSAHRLEAIERYLTAQGLMARLDHREAVPATREQLCRVHDPVYLDRLERISPVEGHLALDADTLMNPHTLEAARHAAGAAILGVDLVMSDEADAAFCAVRPPGHHACPATAMGYCIFNNVAVAAAHALHSHGLKRVAILDFDVHHGNGTEAIFRGRNEVLYCSVYQHPFYPGGEFAGDGNLIHGPLKAGTGSRGFRAAVTRQWLPALDGFRPELVLVSAGFDGHHDEFLAGLELCDDDYHWVTARIAELARIHAAGRIVSVLEGGYAVPALARSVSRHLCALLESGAPPEPA